MTRASSLKSPRSDPLDEIALEEDEDQEDENAGDLVALTDVNGDPAQDGVERGLSQQRRAQRLPEIEALGVTQPVIDKIRRDPLAE